jgi:hypothetical protein
VARLSSVALVAIVALALAGVARADADPASDVLYTQSLFLPLSERVSPGIARELAAAIQAAQTAGKPIRVAVIASKSDLGGVPALYGRPRDYARFLGAELQFLYEGRLLVVMPQGTALSQRGRLVANAAVVHAVIEPGVDGLARSAITLVRELTGTSAAAGSTRGFPVWTSVVIGVSIVCVLLLSGFMLVRRRPQADPRSERDQL